MSHAVPSYVSALSHLRQTLEETADSLANAHLDRLLACEARIETALMHLPTTGYPADARQMILAEVEQARAALVRCRRLGLALTEFIRLGLAAQGLEGLYGRDTAGPVPEIHTLNTTV
jgi:hypothetical protein